MDISEKIKKLAQLEGIVHESSMAKELSYYIHIDILKKLSEEEIEQYYDAVFGEESVD